MPLLLGDNHDDDDDDEGGGAGCRDLDAMLFCCQFNKGGVSAYLMESEGEGSASEQHAPPPGRTVG